MSPAKRARAAPARTGAPSLAAIPRATYRVQLHRGFRFEDARAIVPYLARLGISHLYCSPFLRARPGSPHGYDIVDHSEINPEIGTRAELDRLVDTLHGHDMGLLVDVVPNHMGVLGGDNPWWMDVLEDGPASAFAGYFDIDWQPADPQLAGRVLLPLLGDPYGDVLERGELKLAFERDRGGFSVHYFEHRLPLDPATTATLLQDALAEPMTDDDRAALAPRVSAFAQLPSRQNTDPAARARRRHDKAHAKEALAHCVAAHPAVAEALERVVTRVNGDPDEPGSFEALDALLDRQAYRLAFWRVAGDEINYRRFFDINDLAALRVEEAEVFDATHRLIFALLDAGHVDGLRIDHPDGLLDPAGYFRRLQTEFARLKNMDVDAEQRPLYVVAEKIVAPHEQLPPWSVHGTTGYRFLNLVTGLLIDTKAKGRLERTWRAFVGDEAESFEDLAYQGRQLVLATSLAGELSVMATALLRLARADRHTRDFTLNALRHALAQVLSCFPVYRTYIVDAPSRADRHFIDWAAGAARRRTPAGDRHAIDFVHRVLLGQTPPRADVRLHAEYLAFARRLQQFSAPVAAKGIEDTALYLHQRLIALNEVGSDPEVFGIRVKAFHGASQDRAARWPHTLLASSTHDTKRSEDVRARIAVISERPALWRLAVRRWSRMNRRWRRTSDGRLLPSRNDEYLLYQTLIGTLPPAFADDDALGAYRERIAQYMVKAVREAKRHSSWVAPDADYEHALADFIGGLLGKLHGNLFLDDVLQAATDYRWYGGLNALTMAVLKFTGPGVPDIYQGQQMADLSLVDPDNRRPVDYHAQQQALDALAPLAAAAEPQDDVRALLADPGDGRAKLWATWRLLQWRRAHAELFARGAYLPLQVTGAWHENAVAYARRHADHLLVVVVGRLYTALGAGIGTLPLGDLWGDTAVTLTDVPPGLIYRNVLTQEALTAPSDHRLPLSRILATWPVAVLHAYDDAVATEGGSV